MYSIVVNPTSVITPSKCNGGSEVHTTEISEMHQRWSSIGNELTITVSKARVKMMIRFSITMANRIGWPKYMMRVIISSELALYRVVHAELNRLIVEMWPGVFWKFFIDEKNLLAKYGKMVGKGRKGYSPSLRKLIATVLHLPQAAYSFDKQ